MPTPLEPFWNKRTIALAIGFFVVTALGVATVLVPELDDDVTEQGSSAPPARPTSEESSD